MTAVLDSGNTSWKSLFESTSPTEQAGVRQPVLVFKKAGEPLLIVPRGRPGVSAALDLYPAQTAKARLARAIWRLGLQWGIKAGAQADSVVISPGDGFVKFLGRCSESSEPHDTPSFAILAGNPHAPGRRFLVLVFSSQGKPVAVVKAGAQQNANELVEKEAVFLSGAPAGLAGIPRIRGCFHNDRISAFALDYVAGDSPRKEEAGAVEPMLQGWLAAGKRVRVQELTAWQRLAKAAAADSVFQRLAPRLGSLEVQAAVFHGDLAPWNIKVARANGAWVVLDWERGEAAGPPGWDWFHFVLQPAMLVERQSAAALAGRAAALLESAGFKAYAQAAGLAGHEREWLLAYLLHCRDVLRPAEGSPRVVELLNLLSRQWNND